jgi:hypothetical protein
MVADVNAGTDIHVGLVDGKDPAYPAADLPKTVYVFKSYKWRSACSTRCFSSSNLGRDIWPPNSALEKGRPFQYVMAPLPRSYRLRDENRYSIYDFKEFTVLEVAMPPVGRRLSKPWTIHVPSYNS